MGEARATGAAGAGRRRPDAAVLVVFAVALLLRLALVERQGLWPDEVFSLAMATGHSLEHPSALADPTRGDFVEPVPALAPAHYRRYLAHESPAAGLTRVLRAVRLSDTSPPLYYLLLYAWTRLAGTSDVALRGFSILVSIACLPALWLVASRIGGVRAALPACVLFALAPLSLYYSTEGRMYSLLWLCVLASAGLTLHLSDRGARPAGLAAWVAASAAGLLTHYFFTFVWAAMLGWWFGHPGTAGRRGIVMAALLAVLVVLPWYTGVPEDFARWRVTKDWLAMAPGHHDATWAPVRLALGFVSGRVGWPAAPRTDGQALAVYAVAGATLAWRLGARALRGPSLLLWLWLAAACLGPALVDLWRGTYTAAVPRYAVAGMPAAFLLLGIAIGMLSAPWRWGCLGLIVWLWLPGIRDAFTSESRAACPLRELGRELTARATRRDLVLVHSIPSGVVGLARYVEGSVPLASWVGQLGQRVAPESVVALTSGRRRTFLVLVHTVGEPAPEEAFLREHATVARDDWRQTARIVEFAELGSATSP